MTRPRVPRIPGHADAVGLGLKPVCTTPTEAHGRMKYKVRYLLLQALHAVQQRQEWLANSPHFAHCSSLSKDLAALAQQTLSMLRGRVEMKSTLRTALQLAQKIEQEADRISERIWRPVPMPVIHAYEQIDREYRQTVRDASYADKLAAGYDSMRYRLLEQAFGTRLLVQNADLGGDLEGVFRDFLRANLGSHLTVVQGGHIYDHDGNRSEHQIDIMVVFQSTSPFCPSGVAGGKHDVLVDQVVAAIEVKSTLDWKAFQQSARVLESIPDFPERNKEYPAVRGHWPLRYVVAASTETLFGIGDWWRRALPGNRTRAIDLAMVLEQGWVRQRRYEHPFADEAALPDDLGFGLDASAGLGLGWLLLGINARVAECCSRGIGHLRRLARLLGNADRTEPGRIDERTFPPVAGRSIAGNLTWGGIETQVHNRLYVASVECSGEPLRVQRSGHGDELPPVRLFNVRYRRPGDAEDWVALEEWVRGDDGWKGRTTVINVTTGEEEPT